MWQVNSKAKQTFDVVRFSDCPAKTYLRPDGITVLGRTVINHCQIVGEVARELIAKYDPRLRAALFPDGAVLAAAAHDIGKVSPYFVEKLRRACAPSGATITARADIDPQLESLWGGHAGVSQVTAKALDTPKFVPEILGQHHGFSPSVAGRRANDECFGGPAWQCEREALVLELKACLNDDWPEIDSIPRARLLAGLTSVADWIGSGEFFEDPASPWLENVGRAVDAAGFICPTYQTDLSFEQVFGFAPRAAQQKFIDSVSGPGAYVLEAPMGLGKTEAALYAAYRMVSSGRASGIYFALPTQLTSNKIYQRFNQFLESILTPECRHRSLLLHGGAWMLDTEMGEEGRPGGAWFNNKKRGLLAPFAVGTLDQALMAAMNVKHGFVRALGLAGKVVILDEVHTYDAYTGTLLDALVALLRALHCTVIVLSATLNHDRREQMLGCELASDAYPLITALPNEDMTREVPVAAEGGRTVALRILMREELAVAEALDRAAAGQQVLWIENTVAEAQQRYLNLMARASELGLGCGLLHSRFTADDRQGIEGYWIDTFGKEGWSIRGVQGRILIGTQVLEQSLDLDADFLVSRFAPSDMILQRLGRLWRHDEVPRARSARCEAWLLAPNLDAAIADPQHAFGKTASVYSQYVLCRSLEVMQGKASLCLPGDIRALIEETYSVRHESGLMARWLHELENGTQRRVGRNAMRQLAQVALANGASTLPESKAQSRYSESESFDVLLLRKVDPVLERKATLLTLLDGQQLLLPWSRHMLTKREWRILSAGLMRQIVSVREFDAPMPLLVDQLSKLGFQHCFYLGDPQLGEAVLRVAVVDENGTLQAIHGAPRIHNKHVLIYRDDLGYQVIKR